MRAADIAHYQAKANGRGTAVLLEPPMYSAAMARLAMKFDLQPAIEQGQLCLYYQPVIDLDSGRIAGIEALVRWRRPGIGLVAPDEFIPLAEEAGLILALDDWVVREACRQTQVWVARHPDALPLGIRVNVSSRQLRQPDATGRVAAALAESGLPAEHLILELREEVPAMPGTSIAATLHAIRDLGVRIALDGYGGPSSSIGALRCGVYDLLNLDRAIVQGLAADATDRAIAASIIGLAHTFGIGVTAEGIETGEQARQARTLGCQWGQGYFFAPPLPGEALSAVLAENRSFPVRFPRESQQPASTPWSSPSEDTGREGHERATG